MFNSMFDKLKEVKHFNEIANFKTYNVKFFKEIKRLKESSKSRGVVRTQASTYDGAFLWIYLTAIFVIKAIS